MRPTWLPKDFGAFAALPKNRACKVTGKASYSVYLPDGTSVRGLARLGEGHATFALGKSGHPWVYLVTDGKVDDPAKKIMAALTDRVVNEFGANVPAWSHHLPWVELCGKTTADSDFRGEVHRSPWYSFLAATPQKYEILHDQLEDYAAGRKNPLAALQALRRRATGESADIIDAVAVIWQQAQAMFPKRQFVLEFPHSNLAVDATGTLVLADVIFDAKSVSHSMAATLRKSSGVRKIRLYLPPATPGGKVPVPKLVAPKKAAPKKATTKIAPKKAAPKKAAPKKAAPKKKTSYGWFPTTTDVLGKRRK